MKPIDVLTSPWAIIPDKLTEITEIYSTHLRGEKIDIAGIEARIGQPLQSREQGYEVLDGVALIPIDGVIAKRMNLFTQISGGASSELIARDVRQAAADEKVRAIILMIDSPGGSVDGTQALANIIREASAKKPVVAWADGMMASAAYWMGAAADSVFIAGDTTFVGSIGVVSQHVDVSERQKQMGVKTTEIYAGKYKRIASEFAPLTKDGKAYMQDMVDHLYSVFVRDVATHRGTTEEKVLADMADGRLFIGQNAITAGLADGVSTLDDLIAQLGGGEYQPRRKAGTSGALATAPVAETPAVPAVAGDATPVPANPQPTHKGNPMDKETLAKDHPALFAALQTEFTTAGAAAERARIKDVEAQSMPGHEALIASLKFDGKTTGPEAAVQVLNAHRNKLASKGADIAADAAGIPAVAPSVDAAAAAAAAAKADADLPIEERCKKQWDANADIRQEFGAIESYIAYEKAIAGGRVRTLAKRAA